VGIEPTSPAFVLRYYLAALGQAWPVSTTRFTSENGTGPKPD
jgi:hypothetical protein